MVFAFLCHSVTGTPCRILYSAVFGDDLSMETDHDSTQKGQRTTRKEQLLQVSCRVQSEYGFRTAVKDRVHRSSEDTSNDHRFQPEKGFFRLYPGDPFLSAKAVVWSVIEECAYVMICELDENRLLAEIVLAVITRLIRDHVTSLEQKNAEILLKAEKTAAILHHFLPCGQLVFMNHRLIAQNERHLERTLATK
ncbi:AP-5 complex subunit sigma-1 [Geodia barretti]|uniref:AP-5 complex subunit sigma-1 n=1 Tax=Geodia barretti TaxID=519541 RepID=A0AA35QVJ4_GEOBA|nr:AP-5 complex subunit sigma-1 [Geodia barretti]